MRVCVNIKINKRNMNDMLVWIITVIIIFISFMFFSYADGVRKTNCEYKYAHQTEIPINTDWCYKILK